MPRWYRLTGYYAGPDPAGDSYKNAHGNMNMESDMAMGSDGKVVQTVLSPEEYERLRRVAEQEEKSLKELLRDAATEYTRTHAELDADDPLFDYEPEGTTDEEVSAADADEYLYGDE